MSVNQTIEAWKNPKKRSAADVVHPSGKGFHEMSLEEMNFVAGGNSNFKPQATPTVLTTLAPYTPAISIGTGLSAVSGLVSYTKDCI